MMSSRDPNGNPDNDYGEPFISNAGKRVEAELHVRHGVARNEHILDPQ